MKYVNFEHISHLTLVFLLLTFSADNCRLGYIQIITNVLSLLTRYFYPAGNYMFKVNNRNTRTRCEICSKLTIKTPKRRHWAFQMKNLVQYFTITYRINHRRYSIKKLFLKRSQYSQETAVLESLANKVASFQDSKTIIFLWILHFFYIKTYFEEHLWKVASDFNTSGNRY